MLHSYRGSNVRRSAYIDASVIAVSDSLASACAKHDKAAELMGLVGGDVPELFVTDERRRPIERPRLTVM